MNQESEGHGSFKEVPRLSGKSLEVVRSKDIKALPPPPGDQNILCLVKDVRVLGAVFFQRYHSHEIEQALS